MSKKLLSLILTFLIIMCSFTGCGFFSVTRTFFAMDTVMTVTAECSEKTLTGAIDIVNNLAKELTVKEESPLYFLNKTGTAQNLSEDAVNVINKALYYGKATNNKFSIAVGAATDLWDFNAKKAPLKSEITKILPTINDDNIIVENNSVILKNGTKIDLGGILKGYATDKVVEYFESKGVKNATVNLGGNVYILGKEQKVGVAKPFTTDTMLNLKVSNCSVVTAGCYERCFYEGDNFYHHILDTKTGFSAVSDILGVTVIDKSSCKADALATALFCMGKTDAIKYANENNLAIIIIDKDYNVTVSNLVELKGDYYSAKL